MSRQRWTTADGKRLYGIMAEFDSPEKLIHAAEQTRAARYVQVAREQPAAFRLQEARHIRGMTGGVDGS